MLLINSPKQQRRGFDSIQEKKKSTRDKTTDPQKLIFLRSKVSEITMITETLVIKILYSTQRGGCWTNFHRARTGKKNPDCSKRRKSHRLWGAAGEPAKGK